MFTECIRMVLEILNCAVLPMNREKSERSYGIVMPGGDGRAKYLDILQAVEIK